MSSTLDYWMPNDPPESLLEWVSSNVAEAMRRQWEDEPPTILVEDGKGAMANRLRLVVLGGDKPTDLDPSGLSDCYSVEYDLLCELRDYADQYKSIGGPQSQEQIDDQKERMSQLRKLAADILCIVNEVEGR